MNLNDPNVQWAILKIFIGFICFIGVMVLFLRWVAKQPKPKVWKCTNCGMKFDKLQVALDHFDERQHEQGRIEEFIPKQKRDIFGNKI